MHQLLGLLRLPGWAPAAPRPVRALGPPAPAGEADWVRRRAPARHRDESLSDAAKKWIERLPEELRPERLVERFPRIVNRLASLWYDAGLTEHFLDELLAPRRPGRQGFSPDIIDELVALQLRNDDRLYDVKDPGEP